VSEQSKLVVGCEHGSRRIFIVRSRYQATIGEDITNREGFVCAIVICSVSVVVICSYEL
jgi:hypothetical protein